ncbi:nucleotidyltransferase domain-containing protein [Candidatus Woesearchaeota archaeon]|nr:nucleotidyltransferase domain-containing protein [Candidatus Woesearchaeota archaeon]
MKENFEIAIDFAEKIKKIKGILQIVLFGSVSRGDDNTRSDIDIAVVFDNVDKFELAKQINKYKHEKIQLTLVELKDLPNETELIGALSGEGLILYGRPIKIKANDIELQPKLLIHYSMHNLPQTEKVKLNRALHGAVSKSEFKGNKYKTEIKGLTKEVGVEKIGRGVLLVDRGKSTKIVNVLKRFNAEVKEIAVWEY